jgi:ParB-like chromosome segregation protein Spo0J
MQISQVSVEKLIPYARNSRTHSDGQVAQIAASIKEFGWTNPILIDGDKGIIAGHGRLLAARKLGYKEVPVIELSHMTESQKKAYVIADNQLAMNAGWDTAMLTLELGELKDAGFDLDLIGFDSIELAKLFDIVEPNDIKEQSYNEVFNIIIECKDEQEQEKIFNRLDSEGYKCRVQSL